MSEMQNDAPGAQKEKRMRGVFSSQEVRTVGTGTTRRKSIHKVFWFVEQDEKGTIMVQPINSNYVPTGAKKAVSMEELLEKYSPEPEFYVQSVFPKIRELKESVDQGDKCREKGENFSAEFAYGNALKLDALKAVAFHQAPLPFEILKAGHGGRESTKAAETQW